MNMPSLTVIVTSYNLGVYIDKALDAILSQSIRPMELIIVDDASTDNSVEIIESFGRRDPIVSLFHNKVNKGPIYTANYGLQIAKGDYIYWASPDDCILPGFFEKTIEMALKYPQAGIIFGQFAYVDNDGKKKYTARASKWDQPLYASPEKFLREYLEAEPAGHSCSAATIYKREALLEIEGFMEKLNCWADTFAAWAIGLKYGACYIPRECTWVKIRDNSYSGQSRHSPQLMLDIVSTASNLMKSKEFCDRFPNTYADSWATSYRNIIFLNYRNQLDKDFERLQQTFLKGYLLSRSIYKVAGFFLFKIIVLCRFIVFLWIRSVSSHR